MELLVSPVHKISTIFLAVLYLMLIYRFFKNSQEAGLLDRALAQLARVGLLLMYVSGLWMSIRMGISVHNFHHISSLLSIVIIVIFQMLAAKFSKNLKFYSWMFIALFIALIIIALTSRINMMPKF